jgi:hypothetical protein
MIKDLNKSRISEEHHQTLSYTLFEGYVNWARGSMVEALGGDKLKGRGPDSR